jgi:hypothetical protein
MLLTAAAFLAAACGDAAATTHRNRLTIERVGFRGVYKAGFWTPVWVRAPGASSLDEPYLELSASDSDGVATTLRVPAARSAASGATADDNHTILMYTNVGRVDSAIHVMLTADGKAIQRQSLEPNDLLIDDTPIQPLRSTSELIVQIGSAPLGLSAAFPNRDASERDLGRCVVVLQHLDELPSDWFGYDAVDVLVLATGDAELCRALAADERRLAAIDRWLELGGRLIVVSGRHAPEFLADGQPLARFVPGKFRELVRLPQTRALETFAETTDPIGSAGDRLALPVPRLDDVAGHVEVFGRGQDLPLVVRAPRGFGELTFVGVDLDAAPLADWPGRGAFLQAVLRPYAADLDVDPSHALVSPGYNDLAGAVRQRLGRSFAGVVPIAFPVVAVLVIGYLLLVGPLDYLFVHKLVGRPWVAWVTFPLLLLLVCGGVLWLAPLRRGSGGVQLNQAELVDVDLASGSVRGTIWATLYSPDARRFDLAVVPRLPGDRPADDAQSLVSCLGLPGSGLGGMHARGVELDLTGTGYQVTAGRDALLGVPVLTAATKSLAARWNARSDPPVAAELAANNDDLLVGSLTNRSGETLHDACLLYGLWGYRLGDVAAGQRLDVGPRLDTLQVKTLLARRARRADRHGSLGSDRELFLVDRASTDELLNVMMFYRAVGGESFARLPFHYQRSCDLSRLLNLGRAILVARSDQAASRWIDPASGEPLGNNLGESTLYYRFVIPIGESSVNSDQ